VSSRRAKIWRTVNGPYQDPSPALKITLLVAVMILIVMVPLFGYYQNNVAPYQNGSPLCPSGHIPVNGQCLTNDPFTNLWNGTIIGIGTQQTSVTTAINNQTLGGSSMGINTPALGSGGFRFGECFTAPSTVSVISFQISAKKVGAPTGTISALMRSGFNPLSPRNCEGGNSIIGSSSTSFDASTLTTSFVYYSFSFSPAISITSGSGYEIEIDWANCGGCDVNNYMTVQIASDSISNQNGYTFQPNAPDCATPIPAFPGNGTHCPTAYDLTFSISAGTFCPSGYTCINSFGDASNLLNLKANSTFAGVAISNSPVDIAATASKELFWFETWVNTTNVITNQPWGWFLTKNATLPQYQSYTPLSDTSVILASVVYPAGGASNNKNFYLYEAKSIGQSLIDASGLGTNPYSNCPQTATLYICTQNNAGYGSSFHDLSITMNYTANAPSASPSNVNGESLFCTDTTPSAGPNTYDFCLGNGGNYYPSPCASGNPATYCGTKVFPYLNVNGGPYYIGFWSAAGQTGNIQFGTTNSGAFDRRANSAWLWVPNPCGGTAVNCTQSTTDTGGFFGWLGRGLGGVVNTVVKTVQNIGSWAQNTALGPIGDVLQGMVSWMISQIVGFLNWVGSGFGFPNLGTSMLNFFTDMINYVTQILINAATWITNTGTFILNTITNAVAIFTNTIIVGLLSFYTNQIITFISIILTIITTFFSYITPTTYLLAMDWVWGILLVYIIGVPGFLWWADINVQIFTFVFKMIWQLIEIIWRGIVILKSFIPTEGGTPADLKNPIPNKGPSGGSGAGGKPAAKPEPKKETEKGEKKGSIRPSFRGPKGNLGQGAKDGDPFSMVLLGFMVIVLLYWLSQAAFSPIATVNTAGCYAWSTNCHTQNGITVGTLNTTVFFAFLFSTQHGVYLFFQLFIPLVVIMFIYYFKNNILGDEEQGSGNMFFNWGSDDDRTQTRTVGRIGSNRRETLRRRRREEN
jgi:hypothetical protein